MRNFAIDWSWTTPQCYVICRFSWCAVAENTSGQRTRAEWAGDSGLGTQWRGILGVTENENTRCVNCVNMMRVWRGRSLYGVDVCNVVSSLDACSQCWFARCCMQVAEHLMSDKIRYYGLLNFRMSFDVSPRCLHQKRKNKTSSLLFRH